MPSVWETRFAELVRRLAAMRESTALELLPDLMPVLPVVDPAAPEMALLRRDRLCGGRVGLAAVAGQTPFLKIWNPADSNLLVVLERILVTTGTALSFGTQLFVGAASSANTASRIFADSRGQTISTSGPMCVLAGGTTGAAHPTMNGEHERIPVTDTTELRVASRVVLHPGAQFYIGGDTVNVNLTFNVRWRERVCDPTELQPSGA